MHYFSTMFACGISQTKYVALGPAKQELCTTTANDQAGSIILHSYRSILLRHFIKNLSHSTSTASYHSTVDKQGFLEPLLSLVLMLITMRTKFSPVTHAQPQISLSDL